MRPTLSWKVAGQTNLLEQMLCTPGLAGATAVAAVAAAMCVPTEGLAGLTAVLQAAAMRQH
jgi:hypothetical protein